jgi:hypothetical protein
MPAQQVALRKSDEDAHRYAKQMASDDGTDQTLSRSIESSLHLVRLRHFARDLGQPTSTHKRWQSVHLLGKDKGVSCSLTVVFLTTSHILLGHDPMRLSFVRLD